MLLSPSMPARITRLTILAVSGLLLTFACGVLNVGTMIVYCCLIHLYADTLAGSRALLKRRLLIQCISLPFTTGVLFALKHTGLPQLVRMPLAVAFCLPVLLSLNYKLRLGFSEISQVVTVAILTTSFEANNFYFLTRFTFTQLGIVVSYLTYAYLFPLRHDRAFEDLRVKLREVLGHLARALYGSHPDREAAAARREEAGKLLSLCRNHFAVLEADVEIKRQYGAYRGKTGVLGWELRCAGAFLDLAGALEGEEVSADCAAYVLHQSRVVWESYRALRDSGVGTLTEALHTQAAAQVRTDGDMRLAYLLCTLSREVRDHPACVQAKSPDTVRSDQ